MMRGSRGKIHGTMKASQNGGSGDVGDNDSGRGDGVFDEDNGCSDSRMIETVAAETRKRRSTTTAAKGARPWRNM